MIIIKKNLKTMIKYIIFLLGSIQILLGVCYIFANIGYLPENKNTIEILEVVASWKIDDHIGVLYPILVWLALQVSKISLISYYSFLYMMQLVVAFVAGFLFLKSVFGEQERKKEYVFGSLYLVTFPLVLQCHLSVLTTSLENSLFLMCLSFLVDWMKKDWKISGKRGVLLFVCILLLMITGRTYLFAMVALLLFFMLGMIRMKNKKVVLLVGIISIGLMSGWGVNRMTQVVHNQNKAENSIAITTFKRVLWPYLHSDYSFYPWEIQGLFTTEEMGVYCTNVDYIDTNVGFEIETTLGREEAMQFYWDMSIHSITMRTKEIGSIIIEDFIYNTFPILGVWLERYGSGIGGNAYHFLRFQWNRPILANSYMKFSLISYFCSIIGGLILGLISNYTLQYFKKYKKEMCIIGVAFVMQVLYGTWVGSTRMDYFNIVFVSQVWLCIVIGSLAIKQRKG